MADVGDLIDFDAIETQKENIQSIPGGRSAKQLFSLCSPLSAKVPAPLSDTQETRNAARAQFEKNIIEIAESDDPLEVYDQYIKWTLSAYPSASSSKESGLPQLLERATGAFLNSTLYKNDPRYLKMWLMYIHLFSDSPRETYAYLATHGIGEELALYYEEYAAWLETQGRWSQAEEVFATGVDRKARPVERLIRKYAEFQHRRESRANTDSDGPSSPAMPKIRPALVAKTDPFAHTTDEQDPQARDRAAAATSAAARPKNGKKMAIFADGEEAPAKSAVVPPGPGWANIGSIADRKKENTHEAKPWAGETLDGGRKLVAGGKMTVFRDPSLHLNDNDLSPATMSRASQRSVIMNPKTGKLECVFSDLEAIYPHGADARGEEFSFEELRARHRGWFDRDWSQNTMRANNSPNGKQAVDHEMTCRLELPAEQENSQPEPVLKVMPDSHAPQTIPLKGDTAAAASIRAKKEEKANRTRKIKIMETRTETQTIQLNMDSPVRPKLRKKRTAEATMTIHTKEAMDEVYDMFNQTLSLSGEPVEDTENDDDDDEDDDDDGTSVGESTGTGRFSVVSSVYDGDETTTGDFTESSSKLTDADTSTRQTIDTSEYTEDYTHVSRLEEDEDLSLVNVEDGELAVDTNTADISRDDLEGITPTSPSGPSEGDYFNSDADEPRNMMPHRVGKGISRLPFMTPIVEKTESSVGAATARAERMANLKTPSRENYMKSMADIDELDQFSSPFHEETENYDKENLKIAQPAFPKPDRSTKEPLAVSKGFEAPIKVAIKETVKDKPTKGPVILDAQCNPLDETIRQTILTRTYLSINTFTGYHDSKTTVSGKGGDIRKYAKLVGKGSKAGDTTITPPTLSFPDTNRLYTLRRELGRGAFASAYLVDSKPKVVDDAEEEQKHLSIGADALRQDQEVIKMEDPPSAWEFFILRQAQRRLGVSRPSESIVEALEMHLYSDECFLVESYRNQGTLLDALNICRASEGAMDELLAMFFAIELLRTVEALHSKGIIHGDLKPDNVLLRFDGDDAASSWSAQYKADGGLGWAEKGMMLIDFGRGVDMRAFTDSVQFIADWKTTEADCVEMRELRPWTFQVDYHGLAGIIHSLLFGKYMEVVRSEQRGMPGTNRRYNIRESLKRYWQTEIWSKAFDVLLNPMMHLEGEEGSKLPVLNGLKSLRLEMERYLESNCEKGLGLKGLIRRLEGSIRERRK